MQASGDVEVAFEIAVLEIELLRRKGDDEKALEVINENIDKLKLKPNAGMLALPSRQRCDRALRVVTMLTLVASSRHRADTSASVTKVSHIFRGQHTGAWAQHCPSCG